MKSRAGALRVLAFGTDEPARNLAFDVALLHAAEQPTLRLYGWAPHGLSLGRFQDATAFADVPGDHVLVRRPTGGGAIYHGDEVTFGLVLDERPGWSIEAAYERVHDAVIAALARVGVRAARLAVGTPPGARALQKAWCFADPARLDVVAPDGRKLCGSAQRRVRSPAARVLHHGSLVLRRPPQTPFCAAVEDQVDVETVRGPLAQALVEEIARAVGLRPYDGPATTAELALKDRLAPGFADPALPVAR